MRLQAENVTVVPEPGAPPSLQGVDLSVASGERLLLWGPSRGGKTTLLKLLAGLIDPTEGVIRWDGNPVGEMTEEERRAARADFGMVFQTDALFDSTTVLGNVMLPLRNRGVDPEEAEARAREVLGSVGLSAAALLLPAKLSGGMRKRAGIARAVVARPQVLLADDPFAGLDPATAAQIARLLLEVSFGRTLVLAAPDPPEALPLPRAVKLKAGRLLPDLRPGPGR